MKVYKYMALDWYRVLWILLDRGYGLKWVEKEGKTGWLLRWDSCWINIKKEKRRQEGKNKQKQEVTASIYVTRVSKKILHKRIQGDFKKRKLNLKELKGSNCHPGMIS